MEDRKLIIILAILALLLLNKFQITQPPTISVKNLYGSKIVYMNQLGETKELTLSKETIKSVRTDKNTIIIETELFEVRIYPDLSYDVTPLSPNVEFLEFVPVYKP